MHRNGINRSTVLGMFQEFSSTKSVDQAEGNYLNYPVEILSSIIGTASLLYHVLSFKESYVLRLLQNFQLKNGHVNGSCYTVESTANNVSLLQIASDSNKRKRVILLQQCKTREDNFTIPAVRWV